MRLSIPILNHFEVAQSGGIGTSFGSPSFGIVSSQQNTPRLLQFALRLAF